MLVRKLKLLWVMLKNLLCILWSFVYYIPDNFLDVRVKQQYKLKFCQLFRKMMGENFCFGINMGLQNYIYWYLLFPRKSSFSGTILENYFGRRSPTHESELPMQLRYTGSCEPPGRVGGGSDAQTLQGPMAKRRKLP